MSFDSAYEAITEDNDVARWAFGTGFLDPLDGVDTSVPDGVDARALADYCSALGDDALVLSQRLCQWVTRSPELEVEVALANIALDLLGHARFLYTRACHAAGDGRTEDDLAYRRDAQDFRNVTLVERPDLDFADCIGRLLVFTTARRLLYEQLRTSRDPVLAAVAVKAANEMTYHQEFAAEWTVALGDGTAESRTRMQRAMDGVWPYVGELFEETELELRLESVAVDPSGLRGAFDTVVTGILAEATLDLPAHDRADAAPKGRAGGHTRDLVDLLAELQVLARADTEAVW